MAGKGNVFLKIILLLSIIVINEISCDIVGTNGKLLMTHVLYRHGDRAPTQSYPTDPYYQSSNWPDGWGELTNLGKQQHYALGKWLRQRYGNVLISDLYNASQIYIRSSNVNRTIASAEVNLAGLYPPTGNQVWNADVYWQPIPVHSVPEEYDHVIGPGIPPCPAAEAALNAYLLTPEVQTFNNSLKPMYDYLSQYTGMRVTSFLEIELIRDVLFIEQVYQKPLPSWTSLAMPDNSFMYWGGLKGFTMYTDTPELAKFKSGYVIKEILDRSRSKTLGTLSPDFSMYVYSTHDLNLLSVLNALRVFDNLYVQYAACIMFELRLYNGVYYIEIYYKNPDVNYQLYIPNCGYSCPLDQMYQLYANILPTYDFKTECQLK